jgi:hypothetical protein
MDSTAKPNSRDRRLKTTILIIESIIFGLRFSVIPASDAMKYAASRFGGPYPPRICLSLSHGSIMESTKTVAPDMEGFRRRNPG